MNKSTSGVAIALALLASPLAANAANLVLNGSFETGDFTSWTLGGGESPPPGVNLYPPVVITYNLNAGYPAGAFNEPIPVQNSGTNSPDAAGTRAAYFVSDFANNPNQSLSQTITAATTGLHQIGFSAYAPLNGFLNVVDAQFNAVVASFNLASYNVGSGQAQVWQTFAGATNLVAGQQYLVQFVFATNGLPAKDIVIDQVYVIEGNPAPVPLPAAAWLLISGLAGLGVTSRLRKA